MPDKSQISFDALRFSPFQYLEGLFMERLAQEGHRCVFWKTGYTQQDSLVPLAGKIHEIYLSIDQKQSQSVFFRYDDTLCYLTIAQGNWRYVASANTDMELVKLHQIVEEALPAQSDDNELKAKVGFWAANEWGGKQVTRSIDIVRWDDIKNNYAALTLEGSENGPTTGFRSLLTFKPSGSGRLILLHGEPGTGKTFAIRSLMHSWRDWCTFHYITDPEHFFGSRSDYMLSTILDVADEDEDWNEELNLVVKKKGPTKWNCIILEDCGELISQDAKSRTGPGLAKLLNLVDGLIGQGLNILVLITTNEALGKLDPAVSRPGRCVANVEFVALSKTEAEAWLKEREMNSEWVRESVTLAELYAMTIEDNTVKRGNRQRKVGFAT